MAQEKPVYIAVDLGGTSLRIAVVEESASISQLKTVSSDQVRSPDDLIALLTNEIGTIKSSLEQTKIGLRGAALGIPGLVKAQEGIIYQSPHFPLWNQVQLLKPLRDKLSLRICLENDANQAALGEAWAGAGKAWKDFIMLTLGTGIGGGIVSNGKIFRGSQGFAGEVGHMILEQEGLKGALGIKGTFETLASASGLRLQVQKMIKSSQTQYSDAFQGLDQQSSDLPLKLVQLAQNRDPAAIELWQRFGNALACGICSLANAFGIFHFVLGGGLLGAWDHFMPACKKELPKRIYRSTLPLLKIVPAQLGDKAGLIGAIPALKTLT